MKIKLIKGSVSPIHKDAVSFFTNNYVNKAPDFDSSFSSSFSENRPAFETSDDDFRGTGFDFNEDRTEVFDSPEWVTSIKPFDGVPPQLVKYLTPQAKYALLKQALGVESEHNVRANWGKQRAVILMDDDDMEYGTLHYSSDYSINFLDRGTFYERDPDTGKIIIDELGPSQHKWAFPRFAERTGEPQTSCWSVSIFRLDFIQKHLFSVLMPKHTKNADLKARNNSAQRS